LGGQSTLAGKARRTGPPPANPPRRVDGDGCTHACERHGCAQGVAESCGAGGGGRRTFATQRKARPARLGACLFTFMPLPLPSAFGLGSTSTSTFRFWVGVYLYLYLSSFFLEDSLPPDVGSLGWRTHHRSLPCVRCWWRVFEKKIWEPLPLPLPLPSALGLGSTSTSTFRFWVGVYLYLYFFFFLEDSPLTSNRSDGGRITGPFLVSSMLVASL
jgi:hypothetical protein